MYISYDIICIYAPKIYRSDNKTIHSFTRPSESGVFQTFFLRDNKFVFQLMFNGVIIVSKWMFLKIGVPQNG